MKFRKKPVVIEAHQIPLGPLRDHQIVEVPVWLYGAIMNATVIANAETGCLHIKTLEGEMIGNPGDWIIQGVKGELYPCKNDIFEATYEAVNS